MIIIPKLTSVFWWWSSWSWWLDLTLYFTIMRERKKYLASVQVFNVISFYKKRKKSIHSIWNDTVIFNSSNIFWLDVRCGAVQSCRRKTERKNNTSFNINVHKNNDNTTYMLWSFAFWPAFFLCFWLSELQDVNNFCGWNQKWDFIYYLLWKRTGVYCTGISWEERWFILHNR